MATSRIAICHKCVPFCTVYQREASLPRHHVRSGSDCKFDGPRGLDLRLWPIKVSINGRLPDFNCLRTAQMIVQAALSGAFNGCPCVCKRQKLARCAKCAARKCARTHRRTRPRKRRPHSTSTTAPTSPAIRPNSGRSCAKRYRVEELDARSRIHRLISYHEAGGESRKVFHNPDDPGRAHHRRTDSVVETLEIDRIALAEFVQVGQGWRPRSRQHEE